MRLKILFEHKSEVVIPWNYQYAIQQWIYQTISKADDTLATMLHDHGYHYEGKTFKLFSFGPWSSFPFKPIPGKGIKFSSTTSHIEISFLLPSVLSTFVSGLFQDQKHTFYFKGNMSIPVVTSQIEILPEPAFTDGIASYKVITGARISVGEVGQEHPQYKGPEHEDYDILFIQNLVNKHRSSLLHKGEPTKEYTIGMQIFDPVKTQMITVPKDGNEIKMKGYKFVFELNAPAEIHRTLYYAGAGEECSVGMGWVEKI
jgi:CRISPR-associated endoribonuclease Cas6